MKASRADVQQLEQIIAERGVAYLLTSGLVSPGGLQREAWARDPSRCPDCLQPMAVDIHSACATPTTPNGASS